MKNNIYNLTKYVAVAICTMFLGYFSLTYAIGQTTSTFSANPNLAIVDNAYDGTLASMTGSPIIVSGIPAGAISNIEIGLSMTHTWVGDLVIKLVSPDGTVFGIMSRPGFADLVDDGTGGYGNGADLDGTQITFSDLSSNDAELMGSGIAIVCVDNGICDFFPNRGSITTGPLSFSGLFSETMNGEWSLYIGDGGPGDLGQFISWEIRITYNVFTCTNGVGCQMPNFSEGWFSSTNSGYYAYEGFVPHTNTIQSVCFWGGYYDTNTSSDCSPGPGDNFIITYYSNNSGIPGSVVAGPFSVTPTKQITGNFVQGFLTEWGYEVSHPPVTVNPFEAYWIRIENDIPAGSCVWYWETASPGDGIFYQSNVGILNADLAFCLDVPINNDGILSPSTSNDLCQNAIPVSCGSTVTGTTIGSTNIDAPTYCETWLNTAGGVWYKFTGNGGITEVNTCTAGSYDSKIGVFSGSCGALTCISGNDDAGCGYSGSLSSSVTFCSEIGVDYYIYVTGYNTNEGDFTLTINCAISNPPTIINCPADITVNNIPGMCGANVIVPVPVFGVDFDDDCGAYIYNDFNWTNDGSGFYPSGTTIVTWIVDDLDWQSVHCFQTITVLDIENPEIVCSDINLSSQTGSCNYIMCDNQSGFDGNYAPLNWTFNNTNSGDGFINTSGAPSTIDITGGNNGNQSYAIYDVLVPCDGTISFSWNYSTTDVPLYDKFGVYLNSTWILLSNDLGSQTQQGFFQIDVYAGDVFSFSIYTTDGLFGRASATISSFTFTDSDLTFPSVSDNCDVFEVTNNAPTVFPVGTTTVTWTISDAFGNTNSCAQTVIVSDDELPVIICPSSINTSTDPGICTASGVVLGTPLTSDNCGIGSTFNDAPANFPTGTTTVTWTVVDLSSNSASCTQTVTVTDNENPTITCPADVNADTDPGFCFASGLALGTPLTSDNCGIGSTFNDAPANFPTGTTTVTWTVVDLNSNSASCTQTVNVTDNEDPTIVCPPDVNVPFDPGFTYATGVSLGIPTTGDNCGVDQVFNDGTEPYMLGNTIVTWTVMDAEGNSATCQQTVTVYDPTVSIDFSNQGYGIFLQNNPNPFNHSTTIMFGFDLGANISLKVVDVFGRLVSVVIDEKFMSAGMYEYPFDAFALGLSPGVYFLHLNVNEKTIISKMVIN